MKVKEITSCNCVSYRLYTNKRVEEMLQKEFYFLNSYKNNFIKAIWAEINKYAETDTKFQESIETIKTQNKKYGKAMFKKEQADEVKDAYSYIRDIFYKEKKIDLYKVLSTYMKSASMIYKIYLTDDTRNRAGRDVIGAFERFIEGTGKNVSYKKADDLSGMYFKPMYSKNKKTGLVNESISGTGLRLEYAEDGNVYILISDNTERGLKHIWEKYDRVNDRFKNLSNSCPAHKKIRIRVHCNKKDEVQLQLMAKGIYKGSTKITRVNKRGRWYYFLQVNFEQLSPVVAEMQTDNHKIAVNLQTETLAYVRDDGTQGILELAPMLPRVTEELKAIDQYLDRSRRAMNPKLFNKDGTIKYKKEEMREKHLYWRYSNRYKRAATRRREIYRVLTVQRDIKSNEYAKLMIKMGNNIVLDNNAFSTWGMKICRASKKSKERLEGSVRKKDYTKQIHDRAPGKVEARIKAVCDQREDLNYEEVQRFNTTTYNHFTQEFDIFEELNQKLVVFDTKDVSSAYDSVVTDFADTFMTVLDKEGNKYILQRDLYAASKMLFLENTEEERETKDGTRKYKVAVSKIKQDEYEKWFKEVFYPEHKKVVKKLLKEYKLDKLIDQMNEILK